MKKLTQQQAEVMLMHARALCNTHPYIRFGQSLFNLLPKPMSEALIGTENDFFFWSNKEIDKTIATFYSVCVEQD